MNSDSERQRRQLLFSYNSRRTSLDNERDHLFLLGRGRGWQFGWIHCVANDYVRNWIIDDGKVNGSSVQQLLNTFRNRGAHHWGDDTDIWAFFVSLPEEYTRSWLTMFPGLLAHMVRWAVQNELRSEPTFSNYMSGSEAFWRHTVCLLIRSWYVLFF